MTLNKDVLILIALMQDIAEKFEEVDFYSLNNPNSEIQFHLRNRHDKEINFFFSVYINPSHSTLPFDVFSTGGTETRKVKGLREYITNEINPQSKFILSGIV